MGLDGDGLVFGGTANNATPLLMSVWLKLITAYAVAPVTLQQDKNQCSTTGQKLREVS